VQDMYTKAFDATNFSFHVGDSRHKQFERLVIIAESENVS
jgi:hypothetical protein